MRARARGTTVKVPELTCSPTELSSPQGYLEGHTFERAEPTCSTQNAMALLGLDTPLKQTIFWAYVAFGMSSHLLIYGSRLPGAPTYNATSVVLLTELTKLVLAFGLYLTSDGSTFARDRTHKLYRSKVAT